MSPFLLIFFLISSASFISVSCTLSTSTFKYCNKKDMETLLEMKKSFNNPSYTSGWTTEAQCCNWVGIGCQEHPKDKVTSLYLAGTDISGSISPSIGKLRQLSDLILTGNGNLTGTIPSSIGKLKKLTRLLIEGNPLLTGPIPKSLCSLPSLGSLVLTQNNLTGQIPGCFGANLTQINFSNNSLSGSIPASFLSKRTTDAEFFSIDLEHNKLTGAVPASIASANFVLLSDNQFTDATGLFSEEMNVKYMELSDNRLAFNLPKVKFPLTLETCYVQNNKIYGSIPEQITKLKRLWRLDVSNNELCGRIPTTVTKFSENSFDRNKCLCGAPLKPCVVR